MTTKHNSSGGGSVTVQPPVTEGNYTLTLPAETGMLAVAILNDFRLTLTTAVPVTTSDVTGATTIFCCPYKGNKISLYDGSAWVTRSSAQFSLALGTLTSGRPYDVFCYDNAGTPTLEFLSWTNDTTRATALAYQDGVLVKTGDATRRYLGTFYTTSTTATEDSAANRYLWNYYHRATRKMLRRESTASWTYNTLTMRQANGSTSNQLNLVVGVAEDAVRATLITAAESTVTGNSLYTPIGLDSTTTVSTESVGGLYQIATGGRRYQSLASWSSVVSAGRHYIAWLEQGGGGTDTFIGAAGPANMAFGLIGEVLA